MNLDESIIELLKRHKGRVSRSLMWEIFDNYSKAYLSERLRSLRLNGYTEEVGGWYILTSKGRRVIL